MPDSKVAIIGFGLMGAQIAQVLALAGYDVAAYDSDANQINSGLELIRKGKYGFERSVQKGRISAVDSEAAMNRVLTRNSIEEATKTADIVLEAVTEDLKLKKEIFRKACPVAKEDAVFASNTSTMSIAKISEDQPFDVRERFAGLHFFNPPQVMKLVEIIRTKETKEDVILRLKKLALDISKTPVFVLDSPGFVANRIGLAVYAEASLLLERGISTVRDIDLAMRLGYGYPMGPFELGDLVGLDSRLRNMQALYEETNDERYKPPEILETLVRKGYLGDPKLKSGSKGGYYEYYGLERPSLETKQ